MYISIYKGVYNIQIIYKIYCIQYIKMYISIYKGKV